MDPCIERHTDGEGERLHDADQWPHWMVLICLAALPPGRLGASLRTVSGQSWHGIALYDPNWEYASRHPSGAERSGAAGTLKQAYTPNGQQGNGMSLGPSLIIYFSGLCFCLLPTALPKTAL